jgi:hypothetical protein
LPSMERAVRELSLTPRWNGRREPQRLEAIARTSGDVSSTPAIAGVRLDIRDLEPQERQRLAVSRPQDWRDNISTNGAMSHAAGPDSGVRFDIRFTAPGDRWAYPIAAFDPPIDLSRFDALRLEYRCDTEAADTIVRLQFVEAGGAAYITPAGFPAKTAWQQATVPFEDLQHGAWSTADANGRFDPDKVKALLVGVNTSRDAVVLEVRNVEAVRFARQD